MMKRIPLIGISILGLSLVAAVVEAVEPTKGDEPAKPGEKVVIAENDAAATVVPKTVEPPEYWLGIECRPIPPVLRTQLALPPDAGVFVASVVPKSPADTAKVLQHDILLEANGKALKTVRDLVDAVVASNGKTMKLELIRAGKRIEVEVTPGKRPIVIRDRGEGADATNPTGNVWDPFGGLGGNFGPRLRVLHPGVILPKGAKTGFELADDTSVTIVRKGSNPAEIEVQFEGKTYKTTEDDLDKLPEGIRGTVESMLGGPFGSGWGNVLTIGPQMGVPLTAPSRESIHEEMNKLMEKMNRDMEQMREQMRKFQPPQPPVRPKGSF